MTRAFDDYLADEIADAKNDPGFEALALTLSICSDAEAEAIKAREIAKADHLKAEAEKAERARDEPTFEQMDDRDYHKALNKMNDAEYDEWLKSQGIGGKRSGASLSEAWAFSRGDHMRRDDD